MSKSTTCAGSHSDPMRTGCWNDKDESIDTLARDDCGSVLDGAPCGYENSHLMAEPEDIAHVVTNSPDVTLALVARIRELEDALAESCVLIGELTEDTPERAHALRLPNLRALVEKGTNT